MESTMRKVRTKDGRQIIVPEKGERIPGAGRKAGQPNRISMAQKAAMVWAAEHSDHSADKTLQGFYLHIANTFPQDHARNLNRILPLQIDARHEIRQKVVYRTKEEVIAGMLERGMPQKVIDAIVTAMTPWKPVEVDHSDEAIAAAAAAAARHGNDDVKHGLQDHDGDGDETEGDDVTTYEGDDATAAAATRFGNGT
jgi:hypothetical protein